MTIITMVTMVIDDDYDHKRSSSHHITIDLLDPLQGRHKTWRCHCRNQRRNDGQRRSIADNSRLVSPRHDSGDDDDDCYDVDDDDDDDGDVCDCGTIVIPFTHSAEASTHLKMTIDRQGQRIQLLIDLSTLN